MSNIVERLICCKGKECERPPGERDDTCVVHELDAEIERLLALCSAFERECKAWESRAATAEERDDKLIAEYEAEIERLRARAEQAERECNEWKVCAPEHLYAIHSRLETSRAHAEQAGADIVEQLRAIAEDAERWDQIRHQVETLPGSDLPRMNFESLIEDFIEALRKAADEIERLQALLARLRDGGREFCARLGNEIASRDAEIERLQKEYEEYKRIKVRALEGK